MCQPQQNFQAARGNAAFRTAFFQAFTAFGGTSFWSSHLQEEAFMHVHSPRLPSLHLTTLNMELAYTAADAEFGRIWNTQCYTAERDAKYCKPPPCIFRLPKVCRVGNNLTSRNKKQ